MNFEQIEEVPEPSYNSSMNSGVFNGINNRLNSRQSCVKDGYENQDAEFIGEGNLTLVYKTKPIDGTYLPMALKVFKLENEKDSSKTECLKSLSSLVDLLNSKMGKTAGLARYYNVDEDIATKDIVMLMEYIDTPTLMTHLQMYATLDIDNVRFITYSILHLLKDLLKIECYHGRLSLNNVHIDSKFRVKITDYSYMSVLDKEANFNTEEGSRLDIFCIGIMVLKMLGKIRPDDGRDYNIDTYLENMEWLKQCYREGTDGGKLPESAIDFLDTCFEKVVTVCDLLNHIFILYDKNGNEINRKYSTKDTVNHQECYNFYSSKCEQVKESVVNFNGMESSSLMIPLKRSKQKVLESKESSQGSNSKSSCGRQSVNPIISMSRDMSQCEVYSNCNDDYENTLREFELSQLNQKLRKPRTSNFIGDIDVQHIQGSRLSLCRSSRDKMNTIQEDDQSSKSNEEDNNTKSVTTLSDHNIDKEHTINVVSS